MDNNKVISFNEMSHNRVYIGIQRKDIIENGKKKHEEINFFTYHIEKPGDYIYTDNLEEIPGLVIHYRVEDDSSNSSVWESIVRELNKNDKDNARYNGFLKIDKSEIILTYPYDIRMGAIMVLTHMLGAVSASSHFKVISLY